MAKKSSTSAFLERKQNLPTSAGADQITRSELNKKIEFFWTYLMPFFKLKPVITSS